MLELPRLIQKQKACIAGGYRDPALLAKFIKFIFRLKCWSTWPIVPKSNPKRTRLTDETVVLPTQRRATEVLRIKLIANHQVCFSESWICRDDYHFSRGSLFCHNDRYTEPNTLIRDKETSVVYYWTSLDPPALSKRSKTFPPFPSFLTPNHCSLKIMSCNSTPCHFW